MMVQNELRKNIKLFSKTCTIACIRYFHNVKTRIYISLWIICIVGAILSCCALCSRGYLTYAKFEVKTNFQYDVKSPFVREQMPAFPDVTFCRRLSVKKSYYHNNKLIQQMAIKQAMPFYNISEKEMKKLFESTCQPTKMMNQSGKSASNYDISDLLANQDIFGILHKVEPLREDMFQKCFWRDVEFVCNNPNSMLFKDTFTDLSLCFTMSYNENAIKNLSKSFKTNYEKQAKRHDLTIVIDMKQNESCGPGWSYYGVGLMLAVNDNHTITQFNMQGSSIRIFPGYEFSISLKAVDTMRYTDYLGYCRSKPFVSTSRKQGLPYSKGACMAFCLIRYYWYKCNCTLPVPDWAGDYVNEENFGFPVDQSKSCLNKINYMLCAFKNQVSIEMFVTKSCPCVDSCHEINYVTVTNSRKLTGQLLKRLDLNYPSVDELQHDNMETWINKNIIVVHFDINKDHLDTITEKQYFTVYDLLINFATNCQLFFGISVISLFELLYFATLLIYYLSNALLKKYETVNQRIRRVNQIEPVYFDEKRL